MHILLTVCVGTLLLFFFWTKNSELQVLPCNGWVVSETAQPTEHFVGFLGSHFARQIRSKSWLIECCVEWFMEVSSHCVFCFLFSHYDKAQIVPNQTFVIYFGTWHHVFDTRTSSFLYLPQCFHLAHLQSPRHSGASGSRSSCCRSQRSAKLSLAEMKPHSAKWWVVEPTSPYFAVYINHFPGNLERNHSF